MFYLTRIIPGRSRGPGSGGRSSGRSRLHCSGSRLLCRSSQFLCSGSRFLRSGSRCLGGGRFRRGRSLFKSLTIHFIVRNDNPNQYKAT